MVTPGWSETSRCELDVLWVAVLDLNQVEWVAHESMALASRLRAERCFRAIIMGKRQQSKARMWLGTTTRVRRIRMGTETHSPALTKEIIASLLVEKRAEMLALLQRLYTTRDDTELFRLSAHRLFLSHEIRTLIKRGRALL